MAGGERSYGAAQTDGSVRHGGAARRLGLRGECTIAAFVEEVPFLDQPSIRAGNDELEFVVVPDWGSNLISLVDKRTGYELLRLPDSAAAFWSRPVLYGSPILFPPNRIEDGRFSYGGRAYRFDVNEEKHHNHVHGFVHTRGWKVVGADVAGGANAGGDGRPVVVTEFHSADYEEVTRQFPHRFLLRMTYSLAGNCLTNVTEVVNDGSDPFPFGLGFHTTFRFPEETARFALTAEKRWRLGSRMLPTGELEEIPFKEQLERGMSLEGVELDDPFLSSSPNEARLTIPTVGTEVRYSADKQFKHWVVYNADGRSGFVCPEPYTWVTNAPNLDLPASLTGLQELKAGERKAFQTSITVTPLGED